MHAHEGTASAPAAPRVIRPMGQCQKGWGQGCPGSLPSPGTRPRHPATGRYHCTEPHTDASMRAPHQVEGNHHFIMHGSLPEHLHIQHIHCHNHASSSLPSQFGAHSLTCQQLPQAHAFIYCSTVLFAHPHPAPCGCHAETTSLTAHRPSQGSAQAASPQQISVPGTTEQDSRK